MEDDIFTKRAREKGLIPSEGTKDDLDNLFQNRRMEKGLIPDTRPGISQLKENKLNPIANSTLMKAMSGNTAAQNTYKQATGFNVAPRQGPPAPKPPTQYDLNQQEINKLSPYNPARWLATGINDFVEGTPVGQFFNQIGRSADQVIGQPATLPGTTGSKVADTTAKVIGSLAGFAAPIAPGVPDLNLTSGPVKLAEGALASRAGQAATGAVGRGLERVGVNPGTANRISQNAAIGAGAGAIGNAAASVMQGNSTLPEVARSAGEGALFGGALGGAGTAAGETIGNALSKRGLSRSTPEINEPTPTRAQQLQQFQWPENVRAGSVSEPVTVPKSNLLSTLFGDQGVGIAPFGSNKSTRMVSTEQQIVNNPLTTSVKGAANNAKQAARAAYQNTVDYLAPLKKINRQTYDTALDASRANNLANTLVRDAFVDNEGNVIGKSLDEVMANSRGLGKKVDDYLIARHAITRMERGERVYDESLGITPEKLRQQVATMEKRYPQLAQIGKDWDEFNTNLLDSGVREGLISPAARDAMREQNPNYASMRRQFDISEKSARKYGNGGSGFSGQKAPIKAVSPTGSTRKIVSPLRSAIEQTYAWKNAELRNRTMQEIVKAIQQDPEGLNGIAEIVKKPSTSYKSLDDALREGGSEEFLEQLDTDFKSLFKPHKSGDQNIVRAMVKGNPVFIKVHDQEAVKALLGLGNESSGLVLGVLQKLSNATKRGATGLLAPMFAVKNIGADTVQAAIQSGNAVKHVAVDLPVAVMSQLADILHIPGMGKLAEDFRRVGGEYSALLRGDRALNKSVSSLRREPLLSPKGIAKGVGATVKAPFKALEKVADITENANRIAAYRRELMGKERTPENIRNAVNAARESTTNFSRRGAFGRETEAFVPYSNAAIQGLYRITKAFVKNPVKTGAGVISLVAIPKLYEYASFNNDQDYQKLPARERYRNFIISKNADGTFNKLPMPPEYEAFGAFMTDVLNDVVNRDPDAYKGTLDSLANAFTPPLVSGALQGFTQGGGPEKSIAGLLNATTLAPVTATFANQSFTGAPIVPQRLQSNSPGQQYDEKTSSIAKTVGKKIGLSPMKVDYLIRAYGGDPARLLLPLNSPVGAGTTKNTLLKNFIVDPVFTNTLSDDFYTMKDRITQAEADNKSNDVPLPKWYDNGTADYVTNQRNGGVSKRLSMLSKQKRDIQSDNSLTASEKAQALRDNQAAMNEIYLNAVTKMEQAGIPRLNR